MKAIGRTLCFMLCLALLPGVAELQIAGAAWHALEQPDLKQALEQAPLLKSESLGEPARGVNVWERWFVPNPDGKSWDLLQIYFKEYYGPTWLCAVDLGTGEVKKQRLANGHQFYLSGRCSVSMASSTSQRHRAAPGAWTSSFTTR